MIFEKIKQLQSDAAQELGQMTHSEEAIALKVKYLGKKGLLTQVLKDLGQVDPALRPQVGKASNEFKIFLEEKIDHFVQVAKQAKLQEALQKETIDITLPGKSLNETKRGAEAAKQQAMASTQGFISSAGQARGHSAAPATPAAPAKTPTPAPSGTTPGNSAASTPVIPPSRGAV